jgi:CRISPR system Cascade subunit CasC
MIVELHMLQNFAPSNLNRDDTGSPKDCEFGGHRRARISSQCQKRAIRELFRTEQILPEAALGQRTARLAEAVTARLVGAGRDAERAAHVGAAVVRALEIKPNTKRPEETSVLVFAGNGEIDALATIGETHWDTLTADFVADAGKKKAKPAALPADVLRDAKKALDGKRAADIALFGRMIAELPERNLDAAAQVAHAISTNRVSMEFDFFTAVDDLKSRNELEDAGAGMLGTVEFNSACFYRYLNLDTAQLLRNLGGDLELARSGLSAFLTAAVRALPTGKQNTFAAHQRPSLVMVTVGLGPALSLANAFLAPVSPRGGDDLMANSIAALDQFWGRMDAMYGSEGTRVMLAVDPGYTGQLQALAPMATAQVADVLERAVSEAFR